MRLLIILSFMLIPSLMVGQALEDFRWKSRLIVVFTPSASNTQYQEQVKVLLDNEEALEDRKLTVISITSETPTRNPDKFLSPELAEKYYQHFRVDPKQFETILVGLDGGAKYRSKDRVTNPSAFFDLIDTMPMRRQELRRRGDGE